VVFKKQHIIKNFTFNQSVVFYRKFSTSLTVHHFKHMTDCSLNLRGKKASPNFEAADYILSIFPED